MGCLSPPARGNWDVSEVLRYESVSINCFLAVTSNGGSSAYQSVERDKKNNVVLFHALSRMLCSCHSTPESMESAREVVPNWRRGDNQRGRQWKRRLLSAVRLQPMASLRE